MVNISFEGEQAIEIRLLQLLHHVQVTVLEGSFIYRDFPLNDFPAAVDHQAIALVRDDACWSQLVPSDGSATELLWVCCFHFPPHLDNSGFVGWLGSRFKRKFGTGVVVVCGHNTAAGGVYDYWGIPYHLAPQVLADIRSLTGVQMQT